MKVNQRSAYLMVLFFGNPFESDLHIEKILLQHNQSILYNFVGVLVDCLYPHLEVIIERMHLPVACELDVLVFEQVYSQQVSDCMVFQGNAVSYGVDHLLALYHLHALLGQFLFIVSA